MFFTILGCSLPFSSVFNFFSSILGMFPIFPEVRGWRGIFPTCPHIPEMFPVGGVDEKHRGCIPGVLVIMYLTFDIEYYLYQYHLCFQFCICFELTIYIIQLYPAILNPGIFFPQLVNLNCESLPKLAT